MPVKPCRLQNGDTVAIVAPASPPPDPDAIDQSIAVLRRFGFKPTLGAHVRKRRGFLAGTDRERAADIMRAFADPRSQAIVCMRGGYGAARLLPLLDFELIRAHSKIFIGYSDITSLHCAFLKKANLVSFHGPMLNSDLIKRDCPDFTLQKFLRVVMEPEAAGSICRGYAHKTVKALRPGRASGR